MCKYFHLQVLYDGSVSICTTEIISVFTSHTHILPNGSSHGQDLVTFNLIMLTRSGIDHSWLFMYVFQGDKPVFLTLRKT